MAASGRERIIFPLDVAALDAALPWVERLAGAEAADQVRVVTPAGAIRAGADYIVVGRPIRDAADPVAAAKAIAAEVAEALDG